MWWSFAEARSIPVSEKAAIYFESRLAIRKFDLGISAAPLGVAVVMYENISKIEGWIYDFALSAILFSFALLALVAAIQIHRFQFAVGAIRFALAQDKKTGPYEWKAFPVWFNKLELLANIVGYSIVLWLLWSLIWGNLQ